ncbi:MAG: hypothetical protein ACMXYC_01380 [Candidatus Woesearchaeota archaeon]
MTQHLALDESVQNYLQNLMKSYDPLNLNEWQNQLPSGMWVIGLPTIFTSVNYDRLTHSELHRLHCCWSYVGHVKKIADDSFRKFYEEIGNTYCEVPSGNIGDIIAYHRPTNSTNTATTQSGIDNADAGFSHWGLMVSDNYVISKWSRGGPLMLHGITQVPSCWGGTPVFFRES